MPFGDASRCPQRYAEVAAGGARDWPRGCAAGNHYTQLDLLIFAQLPASRLFDDD